MAKTVFAKPVAKSIHGFHRSRVIGCWASRTRYPGHKVTFSNHPALPAVDLRNAVVTINQLSPASAQCSLMYGECNEGNIKISGSQNLSIFKVLCYRFVHTTAQWSGPRLRCRYGFSWPRHPRALLQLSCGVLTAPWARSPGATMSGTFLLCPKRPACAHV